MQTNTQKVVALLSKDGTDSPALEVCGVGIRRKNRAFFNLYIVHSGSKLEESLPTDCAFLVAEC